MTKLPFKVSARAARLIGRENVSSVEGAITELVKNTYDADATSCVIILLPAYETPPERLTTNEVNSLNEDLKESLLKYYEKKVSGYQRRSLSDGQLIRLETLLKDILVIWIVDNGHGMTVKDITENWMVIGTDNKEVSSTSPNSRVVNGAKGIGRFALDRLGNECDLFSYSKKESIHWKAKWSDFEGKGKVLEDVEAELTEVKDNFISLLNESGVIEYLPNDEPFGAEEKRKLEFNYGTAINITSSRDKWDEKSVRKLKRTLSSLIPPKEQKNFNIYLYDKRKDKSFNGWIERDIPDECDYSIEAKVNSDGNVNITIGRHEFDLDLITPTFFKLTSSLEEKGFSIRDFKEKKVEYTKPISKLMKAESEDDLEEYKSIGPFSVSLYFFKLNPPNKENIKRYPYKNYNTKNRKDWLSNSGGIRLYRDNFRVRPYGEPETHAFDWLLLGQRVAGNPAAVSRIGAWKVAPQNLAGTISISKLTNPHLMDQSNREGIANPRALALFRDILIALIGEFERDRSTVFHYLDSAYKIDNPEQIKKERGQSAASAAKSNKGEGVTSEQALDMAQAIDISEAEKQDLKDDNQMLRGLATLGTVLVSFSHELKQIQAGMKTRTKRMQGALDRSVDKDKLARLSNGLNPYKMLDRWQREDKKVSHWVDFALASVEPKKRRRSRIPLRKYFEDLASHWEPYLVERKSSIDLIFNSEDEILMLAHEIDLDSIFYNLIINSVEVFTNPNVPWTGERNIYIEVKGSDEGYVTIDYFDSGPGISDAYSKPEDIFIFGESTKKTEGDESGTGIGMWILKAIVDDYKGRARLKTLDSSGFYLRLDLPLGDK